MNGFLYRQSGILKIWKRQYYEIIGSALIEYPDDNKSVELFRNDIASLALPAEDKARQNCFKVQLGVQNVLFSTESIDDYQKWTAAIRKAYQLSPRKKDDSKKNGNQKSVSLGDFDIIKVIGRGTFGKVTLVRYKEDGKLYAMKAMSKRKLSDEKNINNVLVEKEVLIQTKHPFLVHAYFCFQTEAKIFIILDYVPGGELFRRLIVDGRFSEQRTQLYVAEILLGIEALHKKGFIYRDLKPENILIDIDGYLKITDFGFAKGNITSSSSTTSSFCGTPEYLAPEFFKQQPYTRSVDWWSLGALMYEMLDGNAPWYDENPKKMYMGILLNPLPIPNFISPDAADLLLRLLEKDPKKRLGSGPTDAEEIKEHPWFQNLDWDKVYKKEVRSPYIPHVEDPTDTSQFDSQFTTETPAVSYEDPNMVSTEVQDAFVNFTCNNEDPFIGSNF